MKEKTLPFIRVDKHLFVRYLFENEYAEEMKCNKCGYVIWPCINADEVKEAMKSISDEIVECK